MNKILSESELYDIANKLIGTTKQIFHALHELDLPDMDIFQIEDELMDINIMPCQSCGTWEECCMLDDYGDCTSCSTIQN